MTSNNLTIYLADDHEIVARAIAGLLLSVKGIKEVQSFSNGKDLFSACQKSAPDLVILDLEMPEWSGLVTLKKIKEQFFFPVIMLSMNDEKTLIEETIKEGAKGYLHKNCSVTELQMAIETVLRGDIFLSEETKKILVGLKLPSGNINFTLTEVLTDKEYEVLKLVCDGLTSKEIGEKLFLSPRTVESRKNNLMQKFNVQTTGKLISLAIKNKIVS
ncbi:MAG: two component transcriptional regulator, LuxR family [Bacteroidetes bacterium]|nr:two component transcriptional regulator, LuxR family [Bacteroidota bacterium]